MRDRVTTHQRRSIIAVLTRIGYQIYTFYIFIECLRSSAKMNNHYENKLSSTALLNETLPDQQPSFESEQMRTSLRRQSILCNSLLLPTNNSTIKDTSNDCQNHYNEKCTKNNSVSKRYVVCCTADKKEKSFLK